jgi:cytochrome c oxidase subunit 3
MNSGRKHLFHIVDPSPWPIITALSAFFMLSGLAFYMHRIAFGGYFFFFGVISVALCMFF